MLNLIPSQQPQQVSPSPDALAALRSYLNECHGDQIDYTIKLEDKNYAATLVRLKSGEIIVTQVSVCLFDKFKRCFRR